MSATPFASTHGALAPVNPEQPHDQLEIERQQERINAPRLVQFLNRTLDAIATLDQPDNLKIHNAMVKAVAYYDGRFDGHCENGVWIDNPEIAGQILPKDNDYFKQIEKLKMEASRTRIRYQVEPVDKSSPAMREAAQFRTRRLEVNQERIETEPFLQAEILSLLLKTISYRYSFFDLNADSQEKSTELQIIKQMIEGQALAVCRTCKMRAEEGVPCAHCGDTETVSVSVPPREQLSIEQQKVPAGRVVTVRPDATMVQLDLNARGIADSSFIRWRVVMRRCDWEAMYPNQRIPSNQKDGIEREYRSALQSHPSNSADWAASDDDSGGGQFEKIEGELVWLDPKVYQRYASREAEKIGDEILPANTPLRAKYKEGCCVARIGTKILDLYPSNKNKCWTMCVYGIREHALHGSGTTALLGPQDIINEENALILAHQIYMSAGREFVRSGALEGNDLPPLDRVGIVNNAPDDRDLLTWAYGRSQPHGLSGDVYAFREAMRGSLQDAAGTSSLSLQGAADMKALGTATGVEASRDQAIGRMIPNRKLQAYAGVQWAEQILRLEHEHYTPEVFLDYAAKGNERGEIQFTERGINTSFQASHTDFIIKPVEGSWVPISPQQVRANATEFASVAAMTKGADGATDGEMLSILAPAYGQDYDVNEWGGDQRMALMRVEEYTRVARGLAQPEQIPTPELVEVVLANCSEWARVNPEMDRHPAYRDFYQDWFVSDSGKRADSLLRAVIQRVYQLHGEGMVTTQQAANKDAAMAQLPTKLSQNVAREIDHQQQLEQREDIASAEEERALGQMIVQQEIAPQEPAESKQPKD